MFTFIIFALGFSSVSFASSLSTWNKVAIDVDQVFVPANFDNNDTIEIVLLGVLPDTCHSLASLNVKVREQRIEVKAYAENAVNLFTACPTITVPFAKVVTIGRQSEGTYQLVYSGRTRNIATELNVSAAPVENRDNLFYAKVNDLRYLANDQVVELDVVIPSTCLKFTRIVDLYDGGNVISLLPAMEYIPEQACKPASISKKLRYKLPSAINRRPLLLHIRSMNGQAFNHVITEYESFRAN